MNVLAGTAAAPASKRRFGLGAQSIVALLSGIAAGLFFGEDVKLLHPVGYLALRDLMGDAAFPTALHTFMARWNGKRPLPWDMFNSFNDATVVNYTWFFQNWYFGYNHMDLAMEDVRNEGGVQTVAVRNPGGMAIPFDVVVTFADVTTERVHRTPAAWQVNGRKTEVRIAGGKALRSVTLDTGTFVDANPGDNTWAADKAGAR